MLSKDHAKQIIYMDYLVRSFNDEELFMEWLAVGVPDGDINEYTLPEHLQEMYTEDEYEEWQELFCRLVSKAYEDDTLLC